MLPQPNTTATPLWLALRLPHLALDGFIRGHARQDLPLAVSTIVQRREIIIDSNPAARKGGVNPGMPAMAALGILDGVRIVPRQPAQEDEALQHLAAWCYQYSSQVSILPGRPALRWRAQVAPVRFPC
jgi:protein ImuB